MMIVNTMDRQLIAISNSGHNAVVRFGKEVSEIGAGRFDVIGFDPRYSHTSYSASHTLKLTLGNETEVST